MSMTANCWFQARVYRPDWDKFRLAIKQPHLEPTDERDGHPVLEVEEAANGWWQEMDDAARAGARFIAHHGACFQFGPGVYASDGAGSLHFVIADADLMPVVVVGRRGADRRDLAHVRAYYRALDVVQALLDRPAVMAEIKEALDGQ